MAWHSARTTPRVGNISVSGMPDNKPLLKEHLAPFVDFALRSLLTSRSYNRINVHVKFGVQDDTPDWAAACPVDWRKKCPSEFEIDVYEATPNQLSEVETLLVISHEIVHVKQFGTGQLRGWSEGKKTHWKWNHKICRETNYWLQPWEVEAHGLERVLLHHYFIHVGLRPFDRLLNVIPQSPPAPLTSE